MHNPLIFTKRIDDYISVILTLYYKNTMSAANDPCRDKIIDLSTLLWDKVGHNLLKRNREINIAIAEQEVQPTQFSKVQLFGANLQQQVQSPKENLLSIVVF